MKAAILPDRGVVRLAGDDARKFLNSLVTSDVAKVAPGAPRFGALLTPQGKIIVDFIMTTAPADHRDALLFDCPRSLAPTLVERLRFYKLRAKVTAEDVSSALAVIATWDGDGHGRHDDGQGEADPRLPGLGRRRIVPTAQAAQAAAERGAERVDGAHYEAHRIELGVPHGGLDFTYADAFPHEADMDQLHGVDFSKGCYIGQEVVSRMEHRGTARNRVVPVAYAGDPPPPATGVLAGDKTVGVTGSAAGRRGLAMLRLDRVAEALGEGLPLTAGGVGLRPVKPSWARFAFPGEPVAMAR